MVLVKSLKFCERFLLCKIHPEKVFGDVLVRYDFGKKVEVFFIFCVYQK